MAAPILLIDPIHPQPRLLDRAAAALQNGELIAYPTDSYYGLGCDLLSKRAIDRLYVLKGHDRKRPMSLLVPDLSDLAKYAKVSNFAYRVIRHLAPGPFTFVLEATRLVPDAMQTRQKTVGLRITEHPVAKGLCERIGRPLVTTSAQKGEEVLIGADEIRDAFGHGLALILDGGPQGAEPSTILSLVDDQAIILRQGKGDASEFVQQEP
ncbi:MAG: threonylcarbamoyl-AMP synthase [Deltaproteobacteria bacterium]|nr:threonylcarbamoyl-AMP synthase [Deltaproteobacteria bacterium]